jgi:DUF1680 family protein
MTVFSPIEFVVFLRIPAWAGRSTTVAVNGRRIRSEIVSGSFFPVHRKWQTGDRIEFEIDQALQYEPVDAQNTNQVALLRGPQVLFALADSQPRLSRQQLMAAKIEKANSEDWLARTDAGEIRLRSFGSINDEIYQTYWDITG